MRKTSSDRIFDLYGSAYLAIYDLGQERNLPQNPELEFMPVSKRSHHGTRLAWTAVSVVAVVSLSIGASFLVW
jgi:hypothetical protein